MTTRFSIQLTKTIVVTVDADSEQEAIDTAINDDDINNGDWERAEHKARIKASSSRDEYDPSVERFKEDARIIEQAEFYDQY